MSYVQRIALDINELNVCRELQSHKCNPIRSNPALSPSKRTEPIKFKNSKQHPSPPHFSARLKDEAKTFMHFVKEEITANYPFCTIKDGHIEKLN